MSSSPFFFCWLFRSGPQLISAARVAAARLSPVTEGATNSSPTSKRYTRILRHFHSRAPKLEICLAESGVVVRSGLTERVLNRCGDAGNLGYTFFNWASKQEGYRHSYEVYKAMVRILGKMRQFGAVWALLEEMRRDNPQLIRFEVFVILMRRFASARMVKKAVEVLDEMPKYGCGPDEYVFGCLLDALCKNGSVKEAAFLFEDMTVRFTPTLNHFTSLLYGWCKEGKLMEEKHVLVQMREASFVPDVVVYNTLLNGYAVAGKSVDAEDLLKDMVRKGCQPNAASYTTLIQAYCGREKMDEAMRVYVEMERQLHTLIRFTAIHSPLLMGIDSRSKSIVSAKCNNAYEISSLVKSIKMKSKDADKRSKSDISSAARSLKKKTKNLLN